MITAMEKLRCVERELGYRRRVYTRLVERGKMSEPQRHQEIKLMEAILEDYRQLAADEDRELPLFIETRRTIRQGG
ncbi:hypothetical protein WDM22_38625 [Bradyrhizobium septentrionale]|uniref:hypothetical protein n=1 Tax=Bradyrhizobium septentrionale TaxID=1404411 RepID=UPI0030CF93D0